MAGKTGSYGLRDIDGRTRIVNYVADAAGFRASIQTNEPGVEPKDPAATLINKAAVAAAPIAVAAPAPVAVAAPAPVAYAAPAPVAVAAPAPVAYAAPAPIAHVAPIAHAAPVAIAAPAAFSYNSVVSHLAGPVALPAPLAAAPLAAAPLAAPAYRAY